MLTPAERKIVADAASEYPEGCGYSYFSNHYVDMGYDAAAILNSPASRARHIPFG